MFCISIENVVNAILKNENIVLCRETAAAYLGLSNGWGVPIHFYIEDSNFINSTYLQGHIVSNIEELETIELNGIICTNEEQTICDLIINDCDIQTILESMSNYYYNHNESFNTLYSIAEERGVSNQINEYEQDAIDYYND